MNVLFLCKNWSGANGICVESVAKEVALEHKVYILCSADTIGPVNENIEYINIKNDILTLASMSKRRMTSKIGGVLNKLLIILQYPIWPFSKPLYYLRLMHKCQEVVKDNNINIIVPVYGPIETIYAAISIKKKNKSIIIMPYFLDSLLGGPKPRLMSEMQKIKKANKVERKVARLSDNIVMMKAAEKCYEYSDYRECISFLDLPLLNILEEEILEKKTLLNNNRISLVYVGNISKKIRDPEILLEILHQLKNPNLEFYFIGKSDCEDIFEKYIRIDYRFYRIGPISYDIAQKYMREADYLLNIGNSLEYMVPSKIFDYMSFNKPIISTIKLGVDPSVSYLEMYNNALILDENRDNQDNACILERFLQKNVKTLDKKEREKIVSRLYLNTPKAFKEHMESVCSIYEKSK